MWAMIIVVADVLVQHHAQMPFTGDQHPVGALPTYRADPALGDRVRPWRLERRPDHFDPDRAEHRVEGGGELAVSVAQQEPQRCSCREPRPYRSGGMLGLVENAAEAIASWGC